MSEVDLDSSTTSSKQMDFRLKIVHTADDLNSDKGMFMPFIIPAIIEDIKSLLIVSPECLENNETKEIFDQLISLLKINYVNNSKDFLNQLELEKNFQPHGKIIHQFEKAIRNGTKSVFEIYLADYTDETFHDYQKRMENFTLFDIDGANCLDDDSKWRFFNLYQVEIENGTKQYNFVGYCSVFEFFAFPDKKRPRISQFVILAPFRRKGLGRKLLNEIYSYYCQDPKVLDITVEDPCDSFNRLRTIVEAYRVLDIEPTVREWDMSNPSNKQKVKNIQQQLRLPASRVRILTDIFKLFIILSKQQHDNLLEQYRETLISRLSKEHRNLLEDSVKFDKIHHQYPCKKNNSGIVSNSSGQSDDRKHFEQKADYFIEEYKLVCQYLMVKK